MKITTPPPPPLDEFEGRLFSSFGGTRNGNGGFQKRFSRAVSVYTHCLLGVFALRCRTKTKKFCNMFEGELALSCVSNMLLCAFVLAQQPVPCFPHPPFCGCCVLALSCFDTTPTETGGDDAALLCVALV